MSIEFLAVIGLMVMWSVSIGCLSRLMRAVKKEVAGQYSTKLRDVLGFVILTVFTVTWSQLTWECTAQLADERRLRIEGEQQDPEEDDILYTLYYTDGNRVDPRAPKGSLVFSGASVSRKILVRKKPQL